MEEKLKILLCEDDENLGMLLREYLQAKGYDTELCVDGEAGYKAFLKDKYDLCVLDVMMPKKDGFSLAKDIRQNNQEPSPSPWKNLPSALKLFSVVSKVKNGKTELSIKLEVSHSTPKNKFYREVKNRPN